VVRRAYEFNHPLTVIPGAAEAKSWWKSDSPHLILDTIKMAEDTGATVIRLYETHGVRGTGIIETTLPLKKAWIGNMLEEKQREIAFDNGRISLEFKPFQVITVIFEA
jgi:alpha-mannosidase